MHKMKLSIPSHRLIKKAPKWTFFRQFLTNRTFCWSHFTTVKTTGEPLEFLTQLLLSTITKWKLSDSVKHCCLRNQVWEHFGKNKPEIEVLWHRNHYRSRKLADLGLNLWQAFPGKYLPACFSWTHLFFLHMQMLFQSAVANMSLHPHL